MLFVVEKWCCVLVAAELGFLDGTAFEGGLCLVNAATCCLSAAKTVPALTWIFGDAS